MNPDLLIPDTDTGMRDEETGDGKRQIIRTVPDLLYSMCFDSIFVLSWPLFDIINV